jgi:glycosyltransferase involved in cell wall biosynthesis
MRSRGNLIASQSRLALAADGLIPTTAIVLKALEAAWPSKTVECVLASDIGLSQLGSAPTVFSRVCDPQLGWLPSWLDRYGARYAYYLDDDLWSYDGPGLVGDYYRDKSVRQALDSFVCRAACVLVSSLPLKDALERRFPGLIVSFVTAPFDFSRIAADVGVRGRDDGPLRVGYAGTERGDAFVPVVEAIRYLTERWPGRFQFEFIGHAPDGLDGLPGICTFEPIADYGTFLRFKQQRGWALALAPLTDDEFSRCKTNNKHREYGALGIPGIYSDVTPYRESVTHGIDGLLVENESRAWADAILDLASNDELRRAVSTAARRHIWERHSLEACAPEWATAIENAHLRPAQVTALGALSFTVARAHARLRHRAGAYRAMYRDRGLRATVRHAANRVLAIMR